MRVIIYTEDGKICREVECESIHSYGPSLMCLRGSGIYTNQPIVACSQNEKFDHMLLGRDDSFDLTMTIGDTVRRWVGAKCLIFQGKIVLFWNNGEWYSVVGQVLIENMKE